MEAASSNEEEKHKKRKHAAEEVAPNNVVPVAAAVAAGRKLSKGQRQRQNKRRRKEEQRQKEEEEARMKETRTTTTKEQVMGLNDDEMKKRAAANVLPASSVLVDDKAKKKKLTKLQKQRKKEEKHRVKKEKQRNASENLCSRIRNNTQTELNQFFSDDGAKALGLALVGNTSLEKLTFRLSGLELPAVHALFDGIRQSQLKELSLRENFTDADIRQCLYQAVGGLPSLTVFSVLIHDDPLDSENAISLGQALMNSNNTSNIRELSFRIDWKLTEEGAQALSLGLQHATHIQKLEVKCEGEGNKFNWDKNSDIAFSILFEAIQHKMQSLKVLTISKFGMSIPFTCIANGLQTTTSLKELVLKNGRLHLDAMRVLSPGIGQNHSVTILRLIGDSIKDDGLIELANHLNHDSCLQEIDMNGEECGTSNDFGPSGIESLMRAITNMPSLQTLNLSGNDCIGYPGWKIIGDALPNLTLHELDLRFDPQVEVEYDYGDEGTEWYDLSKQALVQGMSENEHVWKLLVHEAAYRFEVYDEAYFYADRNLWGRRLLTVDHGLPPTIWCYILERCQGEGPEESTYHDSINAPSLIYYILREQPNLVQSSRSS